MTIRPLSPKPKLINNRYELMEKLGQGGMGAVYRAVDRLSEEVVALKQVRIRTSTAPASDETIAKAEQNRLAITSEFKALASLHHPNIVGVLDYGWDDNDIPYFTMPYLDETENLLEASQRASTEQRLDYLVQLIQALMYVHRRGIVHRDLKPENILVTADERVKVLDFGIAATEHDPSQGILGTMLYMPPELIRQTTDELPISRTSDLYAVGMLAYEMFTGVYPYDTTDFKSLLRDILKKTPDLSLIGRGQGKTSQLSTRLPLQTIIGRLTTKDPNFRYQDAADVLEDLAAIVGEAAVGENTEIRESFLQAATFVGRKAERDLLLSELHHLLNTGQGSTYLIGGESGVGKSRLMEEIRIQGLVQGVTVLRGQALNKTRLPYQIWRAIVRRLVLSTEISNKHAGILMEIIPDIADLLKREIPAATTLEGDAARKRLVNAIVSLFAKQKKPILLLLEDLHWTKESLEVVNLLNHHINSLPLMIIGSFRDDDKPKLPEQLPGMQLIKLNRLSVDEIAELSESMLGNIGRKPEIIDLIQRETEGNVFFVVEVVRVLIEEAGQPDNIGRITLPQQVFAGGIQQVIQHRLEQVINPASHELLKLAATFGRYIDMHVMTAFTEQVGITLEAWCSECANATVLELYDGVWRFTHDKIRDYILSQLNTDEIAYYSRQVAEIADSLYSDDPSWGETLMNLWHDAGDTDRELRYMAMLVSNLAKFIGDYHRVRQYADYALSILPDDDVRRVDFLNPLSQMGWRVGEYQVGYDYAMQANTLAKDNDYVAGLADSYNNLGNTAFYLGHYQTAIIYYRHSADIHHELGNQWDWALNLQNLGWTFPYVDDYESAWDFVEQGQAIFIELDEMWGVANGYYIMALIATHEGDYEDAVGFHHKSLDLNDQYDDAWNKVLNFLNLGFVHLQLGNVADAQSMFTAALRISYEMGFNGSMLEALAGIAWIYFYQDKIQRSLALIGMIGAHSARNSEVEMRLMPLLDKLESLLPRDELDQGIQQGETMVVNAFVRKYLK